MAPVSAIVVVNAGSSSIKFSIFRESGANLEVFLKGQIEGLYTSDAHFIAQDVAHAPIGEKRWASPITHGDGVRHLLDFLRAHLAGYRVDAVGHRVVHGGTDFAAPVRVDAEVVARLERLIPLAPLHEQHNLAPIK